jgi:hypothetical protein
MSMSMPQTGEQQAAAATAMPPAAAVASASSAPSSNGALSSTGDASASSSSAAVTGGVLELRFLLDHASVGGVIGRGGASVRSVRESSLVHLAIVKAEPRQAQERIMVLKGTTAQISNAVKQIAQLSDITRTREQKQQDGMHDGGIASASTAVCALLHVLTVGHCVRLCAVAALVFQSDRGAEPSRGARGGRGCTSTAVAQVC